MCASRSCGQDDPDFEKTLAAGVAPRAMEMVEDLLARKQVLEEVSRIVGIDVAGNVTEIMEPFLEPSLGRYNLFSSYHKSTMEALESLESGKDKRDLPRGVSHSSHSRRPYARRVPGPSLPSNWTRSSHQRLRSGRLEAGSQRS